MAVGDRFKSFVKQFTASPSGPWQPVGQPYPLLATFDPTSLVGVPGLLAIWHLGVRPQWLKVAAVTDLAAALRSAALMPDIISYRPNGGVYVAWALLKEASTLAYAKHLTTTLLPLLQATVLISEVAWPDELKALDFPLPPGTGEGRPENPPP